VPVRSNRNRPLGERADDCFRPDRHLVTGYRIGDEGGVHSCRRRWTAPRRTSNNRHRCSQIVSCAIGDAGFGPWCVSRGSSGWVGGPFGADRGATTAVVTQKGSRRGYSSSECGHPSPHPAEKSLVSRTKRIAGGGVRFRSRITRSRNGWHQWPWRRSCRSHSAPARSLGRSCRVREGAPPSRQS
jgi:hypothetical protein